MHKEIDYLLSISHSKWGVRGMVSVFNNAVKVLNLVSLSTQSLASCVNYFVWNCLPCFSNTKIGYVTSSFDIVLFSRSCAPQPFGWRLYYFTTEAVFCPFAVGCAGFDIAVMFIAELLLFQNSHYIGFDFHQRSPHLSFST